MRNKSLEELERIDRMWSRIGCILILILPFLVIAIISLIYVSPIIDPNF